MSAALVLAQVTDIKDAASAESQVLDSAILTEQFYFFTVVIMWLIHVGFMTYETGAARRKNAMATVMKNILTIAVVTPTMYYVGWWIYGCNQPGFPPIGPESTDVSVAQCQSGIPWGDALGPNLTNNINLVFFLAFLLFSWTTASIMSGAVPMIGTPARSRSRASLSGVCPPYWTITPSGRSLATISSTSSSVSDSK